MAEVIEELRIMTQGGLTSTRKYQLRLWYENLSEKEREEVKTYLRTRRNQKGPSQKTHRVR